MKTVDRRHLDLPAGRSDASLRLVEQTKIGSVDIRLAKAGDLCGIQGCARAAYEIYVPRIGRRPAPMIADFEDQIKQELVHVLTDDKRVAGFVVCYRRDDHLHLENVAVDPQFQGFGYGVQLIRHAEQAARDIGLGAVELYTNAKMTENLTLYPHLGYAELGRWREDGFDRVFYRKIIVD